MGGQAVTHESRPEVRIDPLLQEPEGVGVPQRVGAPADPVAIERIEERLGHAMGRLGWERGHAKVEGFDPATRAGGDLAGAGLRGVSDPDPGALQPGEASEFVRPEAEGGAHAPGPAPVGQADGAPGGLDLRVGGDVALGQAGGAVAPAGGQEAFVGEAEGSSHLGEQVALVPAAGGAFGEAPDDPEQDGLGDGA